MGHHKASPPGFLWELFGVEHPCLLPGVPTPQVTGWTATRTDIYTSCPNFQSTYIPT